MSVLYVLLPVALVLVIAFVWAYAWSSKSGQFDDLTTPAMRILHDDARWPPAIDDPSRVPPAVHSGSPPRRSPPAAAPPPWAE